MADFVIKLKAFYDDQTTNYPKTNHKHSDLDSRNWATWVGSG